MPQFMNPPPDAVMAPSGPTWLDEDGIVITINNKHSTHSLEDAIENLRVTKQVAGDKRRPLLVDMTLVKSMSREAREEYVKQGNEEYINSVALITKSHIGRMVANLFINIQKQRVPVKMFNDPGQAKEWLMQYVNT